VSAFRDKIENNNGGSVYAKLRMVKPYPVWPDEFVEKIAQNVAQSTFYQIM
jgi:hypothetical protein